MTPQLAATQYCERAGGAFWSEPVNALTNAAFLLVALIVARQAGEAGVLRRWDIALLVVLTVLTGVGSFLWHTLATPWSEWADVIPIVLFIQVYLVAFLLRIARPGVAIAVVLFVGFQLVNAAVLTWLPRDLFNGSVFYLPTLGALLLMTLYCRVYRRAVLHRLAAMTALFSVSLALRTLDAAVCGVFPLGTHFAWHLLNAAVLYLSMRSLID